MKKLVPADKNCIGLVTFQNGIANSLDDFKKMGELILSKLAPENPLCIGLYYPTCGLLFDLHHLANVLNDEEDSSIICAMRQMFITFAERLREINPKLRWLHIAHSKGGLIAYLALKGIKDRDLAKYLRENLIVTTYGSVRPIPKSLVKDSINTYSVADKATWKHFFGKEVLENGDYELAPVPSKVKKAKQDRVQGDHDFQDETYQEALLNNLKNFRDKPKIYDSRKPL